MCSIVTGWQHVFIDDKSCFWGDSITQHTHEQGYKALKAIVSQKWNLFSFGINIAIIFINFFVFNKALWNQENFVIALASFFNIQFVCKYVQHCHWFTASFYSWQIFFLRWFYWTGSSWAKIYGTTKLLHVKSWIYFPFWKYFSQKGGSSFLEWRVKCSFCNSNTFCLSYLFDFRIVQS